MKKQGLAYLLSEQEEVHLAHAKHAKNTTLAKGLKIPFFNAPIKHVSKSFVNI
jgi:hypothetical protein